MDTILKRLHYIKWLQSIGIEYYCSLNQKDSKNNLRTALMEQKSGTKQKKDKVQAPTLNSQSAFDTSAATSKSNASGVKKIPDSDLEVKIHKARAMAESAGDLKELYKKLCEFEGCKLKAFANNTVFSDGSQDAEILLIGEAPGATEDEKGIPFCGDSGQLLDKILETIGVSRKKNAYITNTVFWRPPGNRRPTREEIELCRPFVEKHIALKKPKIIILIGGTATASFLDEDKTISKIRSETYSYINQYLKEPIPTTALFHPAYLLRQPLKKKDMWYDLLKIKEMLTKLSINI